MGAYLSKPITEKELTFEENNSMAVVSCSMQGWRTSQEDSHNAILDYGVNSSLFAVYDGHGGSEVAKYCALHLPEFIKENKVYQSGDFEKGLVESFVSFDKSLTNSDVVDVLKKLSGDFKDDDEDQDEHDPGEVNHLYEEATMPIEHVIAKYHGELPSDEDVKDNGEPLPGPSSSGASTSRPVNRAVANLAKRDKIAISPSLRGKTVSKVAEDFKTNGQSEKSDDQEGKEPRKSPSAAGPSSNKPDNLDAEKNEDAKPETSSQKEEDSNTNPKISSVNGSSPIKNGESDTAKTNGIHEEKTNGEGKTEEEEGKKIGAQVKDDSTSTKKRCTSAIELYHKVAMADPDLDDEDLDDDSDQSFGRSDGEDSNETEEDQEDDEAHEDDEEEDEEDTEDEDDDDDEDDDEDADDIYETAMAGKLNEIPGNDSGCTAVVAVLSGNNLFVANAGDSRCIVSRNGKAVDMSEDHKPEDPIERARIEKAGGSVTLEGRVNGGLNLSRALGDHAYKKTFTLPHTEQMISPVPDIRHLKIDPETDSFVFLACDGIWNSMSSQEVVDFISKRLSDEDSSSKKTLESICEELFEHCLAPNTMGDGTGCDNMTAVLVKLKPGYKTLCGEASNTSGVKRTADATNDVEPERPIKKSKAEDENTSTETSAPQE